MTVTTEKCYLAASLFSCSDHEQKQDDDSEESRKLTFASSHLPQQLSPMEVCIHVAYTDVNPVDVQKLEQYTKQQQKLKKQKLLAKDEGDGSSGRESDNEELFVPGYGGSGYVEEIGGDVPKGFFKTGQAVAFLGDSSKRIGSYGTYVCLDYRLVAPVPVLNKEEGGNEEDSDSVMEAAACIGVAGNTAYEALEKVGLNLTNPEDVKQNFDDKTSSQRMKTLLVVGGSGGVGSWVTRLARAVYQEELEIVATSSTPNDPFTQKWILKENGATRVIGHDEIGSQEKLPGGRTGSCDYIICLTEPTTSLMSSMAEVIKPFGTICLVVAGSSISNLNLGFVFFKSATVTTETVFSNARNGFMPLNQSAQMAHMLQMMYQKQQQNDESTVLKAPLRLDRYQIPGVQDWTRALEPGGVWEVMSKSVMKISTNTSMPENSETSSQKNEPSCSRHYGKLIMRITTNDK